MEDHQQNVPQGNTLLVPALFVAGVIAFVIILKMLL